MSKAKFDEIAQIIEQRIDQGAYALNSKLPTHRQLAEELKTTPVTIAKAYNRLAEKGRVISYVGRGTFVAQSSELQSAIQAPEDNTEFNFSILQPALHLNLPQLRESYQYASQQLNCELMGYVDHSGHAAHRQAGVNWAGHYGLAGGNADNTLLTNGAQHALFLLISALTQPGDTIAVEALTYPGILAIASMLGRNVVGVAMDQAGMQVDALQQAIHESAPKLVVVIPSHQNPTGVTMPEARRKEIAQVITQSECWLIEDDLYGFLNDEPIAAISNFCPAHSFHVSSLSKVISPAMRCGYIKAPESQVSLINAHIRTNSWLASPINYIAATQLIESGAAFDLALSQRRCAQQRQQLAAAIFPEIAGKFRGYHIWLPLREPVKSPELVVAAQKQDIILSGGSYFDVSGHEINHVRLSLMAINREQKMLEGLNRLKQLTRSELSPLFPF